MCKFDAIHPYKGWGYELDRTKIVWTNKPTTV